MIVEYRKVTIGIYRYTKDTCNQWLTDAKKMNPDQIRHLMTIVRDIIERSPILIDDDLKRLRNTYRELSSICWEKEEQLLTSRESQQKT